MNLERDQRWGDISLSDFENKIPMIRWKKNVNQEIKDAFLVIQKLLIHSYYEYLFIDTAVIRSFQIFEMALKIRYKEINIAQWDSKRPLVKLIEWFRTRDYFERQDKEFFEYVRSTRNYLSHPERHNIHGMWFHWIETTMDLINDLYEDIKQRKIRRTISNGLLRSLYNFSINGMKIKSQNQERLFYNSSSVLINNWAVPVNAYISLLPVFDPNSSEPKFPTILHIELDSFDLTKSSTEFVDGTGNRWLLTADLSMAELNLIAEIKQKIVSDEQYLFNDSSLHFAARSEMQRIWRRIRFEGETNG